MSLQFRITTRVQCGETRYRAQVSKQWWPFWINAYAFNNVGHATWNKNLADAREQLAQLVRQLEKKKSNRIVHQRVEYDPQTGMFE
jgi:hypothetical protein